MEQKTNEQWEYRTYHTQIGSINEMLDRDQEVLTELGKQGWDVYNVMHGKDVHPTYYLKRRVQKGRER